MMTLKGPQQIRKQNIRKMQDLMEIIGLLWCKYHKLANNFMYATGASKYKTREYYDIIMNMFNDYFETRENSDNELEFRYIPIEQRVNNTSSA